MSFENYIYLEEILSKNPGCGELYTLKLLKANNLFELGNFKEAKKIVSGLLEENLIINTMTFNTLIKLGVLLGSFETILEIIKKSKAEINFLNNEFFYVEVMNEYYEFIKNNKPYPVEELLEKANDSYKKSLLHYICFLLYKNDERGKEFLRLSLKESPLNLSTVYGLIDLGEEVEDNSLKFALEVDITLFNKIDFIRSKEVLKNEGLSIKNLNLEVYTLGGGDSIGGSCYILSFGETRIMVDAGATISKESVLTYPDFKTLEEKYENIFETLDYFLITHGHLDHCGAILQVYKKNPRIKLLMTEETREIVRANLTSAKMPFEEEVNLETCLKMATVIPFRKSLKLKCKDNSLMDIEFFRAGHILGAASIYVKNKNAGVFITGDYCLFNQETVQGMDIPKGYKIDLLITENTYGNKINEGITSRSYEEKKFIYTVKTALKTGKKVLIPSFSIGRAQEIISILKTQLNVVENERLYLDGMVTKINKIYEKYLNVKFKGDNIYTFDDNLYDSKGDFINQEVLNNKSCVVASSGMLQKGSSVMEYAKKFLKREDCVCILTGYQAEDTIGSKLKSQMNLQEDRYISIDQELIKIKCQLKEAKLSAHCTIEEILVLVTKVKPSKILLVHGKTGETKSYIHQILDSRAEVEVIQAKNNSIINI